MCCRYCVHLVHLIEPTLHPVGDDSIGLFTLCHSPADAAVGLGVRAHDRTASPSSSIRVQWGIGRGQEAGRVWISCPRVVGGAVASEAVCVCLARGSVAASLLSHLCCHLIARTSRAGAAVGRRQQLPLRHSRREKALEASVGGTSRQSF